MSTYQKLKDYAKTIVVGAVMAASFSGLAGVVAAEDVKKEAPLTTSETMYSFRKDSRGDILRIETYKDGNGTRNEFIVKLDNGAGNWTFSHLDTIKLPKGECLQYSTPDINKDGIKDLRVRAGPCDDFVTPYHIVASYLNDGKGNFTKTQ